MTAYKETLDWMFAQLPMYQHKGANAFNSKLDGIKSFANYLGNPHHHFKSIHVAGTNGKGSSSHMLASVLQEAGCSVGLYTSPHLKDFRERIRINGQPIAKDYVVDFISIHKGFFEKNRLSFFEMTVGMAFEYFANKKVDIAIIEVGLGGRLDSTNIITPEVSLITNIGYDHMDMLGDTLEKIAYEKGGIIKEGVPVVISEAQEEIAHVFESIAEKQHSKLVFADRQKSGNYKTSLLGEYQEKNIKGVVVALKELRNFKITNSHIVDGLLHVVENTGLMGRWHQLGENPKIICDTAHNKEGLQLVLRQLQKEEYRTLHVVLGFVKDKNLEVILPLLPKNATYYFCQLQIPRGMEVDTLQRKAIAYGLNGKSYMTVNEAVAIAKQEAVQEDFIFIGGSNFTVAEVL